MTLDKIGESSSLQKCQVCGGYFRMIGSVRWCMNCTQAGAKTVNNGETMKTKNLTLAEAIKTGLPFKRADHDYWWQPNENACFSIKEIFEPIWEVKREAREFWAEMHSDGISTNLSGLEIGEKIKLKEVIDE